MPSSIRLPRHLGRLTVLAATAAALLALVACSGDEPEPTSSRRTTASTTASETSATTAPDDEPTTEETTPEETTEETTEAEDVVVVDVTVADGVVTATADRVLVEVGQTLRLTVTSDVADELHVHGYEIEAELPAGQAVTIDVPIGPDPGPGLYEVETHESELLLFQLEVR